MSNSAESSLQQWAILLEKEEEKKHSTPKKEKKYNTSDSQPLICSLVISKVHDAFFLIMKISLQLQGIRRL